MKQYNYCTTHTARWMHLRKKRTPLAIKYDLQLHMYSSVKTMTKTILLLNSSKLTPILV